MKRFWLVFPGLLALNLYAQQLVMEVGVVSINHTITRVATTDTFHDPVVIALPSGYNGSHEVAVRIAQVDSMGFDVFLEEPVNRDGPHTMETVHYVVVEAGSYTFADGTTLEAGYSNASNLAFQSISFLSSFSASPSVFTQVQSNSSSTNFLHTRQRNTSGSSFQVKLEREESLNSNSPSSPERIGYFAIEKKSGALDGVNFAAGSYTANQAVTTTSLPATLAPGLHYIASISTFNGPDPATLRWTALSNTAVSSFVDEDISSDSEVAHANETIDYFAINDNNSGPIYLDVALKIELLSFEALAYAPGEVNLRWVTSTALAPNDYFIVERSRDGISWEAVQRVAEANQQAASRLHFATTDRSPYRSTTYYRLKQVEVDGRQFYSAVREVVPGQAAATHLQVYPNPVTRHLYLKTPGIGSATIAVYNLAGQDVSGLVDWQYEGTGEFRADISRLRDGMYFIQIGEQIAKFIKK